MTEEAKQEGEYFVSRMRPGAISTAPWGIYHSKCSSPQPYEAYYDFSVAEKRAEEMTERKREIESELSEEVLRREILEMTDLQLLMVHREYPL